MTDSPTQSPQSNFREGRSLTRRRFIEQAGAAAFAGGPGLPDLAECPALQGLSRTARPGRRQDRWRRGGHADGQFRPGHG